VLTRYLAHVPEVDAFKATQKPNLVSHFVHKQPQFGLTRDAESSKSFQEPQPNNFKHLANFNGSPEAGDGTAIHQTAAGKAGRSPQAYLAPMSPLNMDRVASEPAEPRAVPRGHLSDEQKAVIGRCLLQAKASLPHGHFGPWLEKQEGLSRGMALQCMALARASGANMPSAATGKRQDARAAS